MKNVEDVYPLCPMQEGMMFHTLLTPGTGAYVVHISSRIEGDFDVPAFKRSWQKLLDRHPILRSAFLWDRVEKPLQVVRAELTLTWNEPDWRSLDHDGQEQRLHDYVWEEHRRGFDLGQAPLMRMALIRLDERKYQFIWNYSHLLLDGWSVNVVFDELFAYYRACSQGRELNLPRPRPYRDFIGWMQQQNKAEAEAFWKKALLDFTAPTPLGIEELKPGEQSHSGPEQFELAGHLDRETTAKLQTVARQHRLTVSTVTQGVWTRLLSCYSRTEDVVFGVTVTGRPVSLRGVESVVGLLVNTLPMRVRVRHEEQLMAWLKEIQDHQVEIRKYEASSLVEVRDWSGVPGNQPLFESFVVFENHPVAKGVQELHGNVRFTSGRSLENATYPLVYLTEPGEQLPIRIMFDHNRFHPETMQRLLEHVKNLLTAIADQPEQRVGALSLLSSQERQQIVVEWNRSDMDYAREATVCDAFEQQAARTPSAPAVVYEDRQLSYGELNCRANQLAQYLRKLGVVPEVLTGICIERSIEQMVAILAVLKAGGAYVPLDPDYPAERLAYMLKDANAPVVLTRASLRASLPVSQARVVTLDEQWDEIGRERDANPERISGPGNTIYVIYTSGSTGKPKGVMVSHRNVMNHMAWMLNEFPMDEHERLLHKTAFSFDACFWEFFGPWMRGGQVVLLASGRQDTGDILRNIQQNGVTRLQFIPSALKVLLEQDSFPASTISFKRVFCGGEALTAEIPRAFFERCNAELHNIYGPTETTIISTFYRIAPQEIFSSAVPIGRPIGNTQLYVLDLAGQPVPAAVAGELYIGGEGVARGYLNRPELTAERFVPDPFSQQHGARMYRTGDLVKWRADGNLEFLGRTDHQTKIRGYRIELGEIEAALHSCPAVEQAVVLARTNGSGESQLVAYAVMKPDAQLLVPELRGHLRSSLPEHMVPAVFVELAELPLMPNGKVNRHALPAPDRHRRTSRAPRTPQEEMLCAVFAAVLGLERVGIDDNFFDLGGHSLLAMRLISRVRVALGVELALRTLFEFPTAGELAPHLSALERARPPLTHKMRPERLPLSYAQLRLWFIDQLEGSSPEYNIPEALRLSGELDRPALEQAMNAIVERHEILRTHFAEIEGGPVQIIAPKLRINVPVDDLSDLSEAAQQDRIAEAVRREYERPFDLARGPLLRMRLLKLGERQHILLLNCHHVISDAWSQDIFNQEFITLYEAFHEGRQSPLQPLPVQYADFALWQREWLNDDVVRRDLDYWKQQLAGIPEQLELPTDKPRGARRTFTADVCSLILGPEQLAGLKRVGQASRATLFMTLLSAFAVLLERYSGQEDIVVGCPIANRQEPQLEQMIGFFVNSLVMRVPVKPEQSFHQLLTSVRSASLEAYKHQDIPFERLVEELAPQRSLNTPPIFQIVLALQNAPVGPQKLKGLEVEPLKGSETRVRFDLEAHVWEDQGQLKLHWVYNCDLFDRWRVDQMVRHYGRLLDLLAASPDVPLHRIELLNDEERRALFEEFNRTDRPLPQAGVAALFEQQAARTPDAPAVVYGDRSLSYSELNLRANRLAHHLISLGVGPEMLVGLAMERSLETIVVLLGILKAGGAYLPLAADLPALRRDGMIADAGLCHLITTADQRDAYQPLVEHVLTIDEIADLSHGLSSENPSVSLSPLHPCYVNYTSGSTGQPKGVLVPHISVVRLVHKPNYATLDNSTRIVQLAPLSFDPAAFEIWGALLNGGTVVVMPAGRSSVEDIAEALKRYRINTLWLTAGLFHEVVSNALDAFGNVRQLLAGGDVLSVDHVRSLLHVFPHCRLINGYGPTENSTFTTCHPVSPETDFRQGVPIGFPIWNTRVYVLDKDLKPVPLGVIAELYAAGAGLARGYLNNPALTADRFLPDPYAIQNGTRMYRTGDLVRWNPEGALQFFGRADHQIKIRGFRVELGEIEAALRQVEGIRECAAVAWGETANDKSLAAYIVPEAGAILHAATLRQVLGERLPDYMVPAAFVTLDALPLGSTGKLDRRSLPRPERRIDESYRAPRTPLEEMLCEAFADVLGLPRVGIDDDFFELGGHSLMATRLVSRIRAMLDVELALRTLFESPTVAGIMGQLHQATRTRPPLTPRPRPERLPLSYAQQRLWFVDQFHKSSSEYNLPEALRLRGALNHQALERTIQAIVERHEILRTHFAEIRGEPLQVIEPQLHLELVMEDFSGLDAALQRERVSAALRHEQQQPFDLSRGPLLRMKLLKLAEQEHILLRTFHHIVSDAWSHGVFIREFKILYESFCEGRESPLEPLAVQYADFALWQREWLNDGVMGRELEYWKEQLAGIPEQLALPMDRPRPPRQTFGADVCTVDLPAEQLEALKRLGHSHHATLYITLLSAFALLLERYSGQQDIVVGSPIANRQEAQLEQMIGFFVNSLVMRINAGPELSFSRLLAAVRSMALEAYQHQDLPFDRLVEELAPRRSLNSLPLFQVMFALQNAPIGIQRLKGLEIEIVPADDLRSHCDLELHAWEHQNELHLYWAYNRDLFDEWRIAQMARHYERLLAAALTDAGKPTWQFDLLGAEERQQILVEWNQTQADIQPQCIHGLFEQQVERTPEATALVSCEEELSYRELNERSNRLAHYLRKLGVGPEVKVGICMERDIELVVAMMAVLKAGGAYVPLDPSYPAERLQSTLEDSKAPVLLVQQTLSNHLPSYEGIVVKLDAQWEAISRESAENPERTALPENLAYLIYTSGSTGKPKGIAIRHSSAAVMLHWAHQVFSSQELAGVLASTSICFDMSVFEIFAPLSCGGAALMADNALELAKIATSGRITLIDTVPSAIRELVRINAIPESVRTINLGGEALPAELVRDVYAASKAERVINLYGPSEDTTFSTYACLERDVATVPIGRPLTNSRACIVNEWMQPVPAGVAGELYLAGDGLARGYLNRSDMTAERFVPDPFSARGGERMYRTGDLVRWRQDGILDYLGRMDQQVKIRGFRIEPGEVEAVLSGHDGVSQAAVVLREDSPGDKQLVAYIVADSGHSLNVDELRQHLRHSLPDYMVPSAFVVMDALPFTPNGKLDKKALPPPEDEQVTERYLPPRSELESAIARAWQEVLKVEKIGVHDNFFDRGGHSLLARLLQAKLSAALEQEVELVHVFQYSTIASFAEFMESSHRVEEKPENGMERITQQKRAMEKMRRARTV